MWQLKVKVYKINLLNKKVLIGVSICASSFWYLIYFDLIRKTSSKRNDYSLKKANTSFMMILFTFVAILFIFILNTITIGKTGSCKSFISRILSQSILVNQIFKQIFLSFISCYIIQFIHKQLDEFFFKNLTSIYDSLFSHLNTVVDNSLNQKDAIYENLTVEINRSSKLKIECFIIKCIILHFELKFR